MNAKQIIIRHAHKIARILGLSCLFVCQHGTTRLPLDGFSWNLIF